MTFFPDARSAPRWLSTLLLFACAFARAQPNQSPASTSARPSNEESQPSSDSKSDLIFSKRMPAANQVELFRASHLDWLNNVACKGSFKLYVSTTQLAPRDWLRSEADASPKGEFAAGHISKMGDFLRIDTQYPDAMAYQPIAPGSNEMRNVPHTSITSGTYDMEHDFDNRPTPTLTEVVKISRRVEANREMKSVGINASMLTPFNLGSSQPAFELPRPSSDPGEVVTNVIVNDELHRTVRLERTDQGGEFYSKSLTFDLSDPVPLLVTMAAEIRAGGTSANVIVKMEDFVRLNGYRVPRRVRERLGHGEEAQGTIFEWVCTDLGSKPPAAEDFELKIKQGVKVRGLRKLPPAIDGQRTLTLVGMTDDQLFDGPHPVSQIQDPTPPQK